MGSPVDPLRERMLREAVLAGDASAWLAWYDALYEPLERYVRWRCGGHRAWADEILQETWLTAVTRLRAFDPDRGSLLDWLRGVARNHLRNVLRRERRTPGEPAPAVEEIATKVSSSHARAEDIVDSLERLAPRHEAVLRAKYLDGLSVLEIAAEWNESPKAIESLLTRARQSFRDLFPRVIDA